MSTNQKKQFQTLLQQHEQQIYRICYGYSSDATEVADLFQEVVVAIWKSMDRFRGDAAWSTWIYRITVNTCLMYIRKKQKRRKLFVPIPDTIQFKATDNKTIEEKQLVEQQLQLLRQAIQSLKKLDRLIALMLLEGLSYKEIAEVTGISVNYVGVKVNRIKEKLKKLVANNHSK